MSDLTITFENGIGIIDDDAFESYLPEGLTLEHFQKVDDARDEFTAAVGNIMLDEIESGSGEEELTVSNYSLGGSASLTIDVNRDSHLTSSITISGNSAILEMMERSEAIYSSMVVGDEAEED